MDNTIFSAHAITLLTKEHDRSVFCCGVNALDRYVQEQATQDMRKHVAATFVLTQKNERAVLGYYTLSATSIALDDLPENISKKLPKYPLVPATLLGRLAVDKNQHDKKFGELLLIDALHRSYNASSEIGSMAVVVDAKDEKAISFYQKYGFIVFSDQPHKLFLPMKVIENL